VHAEDPLASLPPERRAAREPRGSRRASASRAGRALVCERLEHLGEDRRGASSARCLTLRCPSRATISTRNFSREPQWRSRVRTGPILVEALESISTLRALRSLARAAREGTSNTDYYEIRPQKYCSILTLSGCQAKKTDPKNYATVTYTLLKKMMKPPCLFRKTTTPLILRTITGHWFLLEFVELLFAKETGGFIIFFNRYR